MADYYEDFALFMCCGECGPVLLCGLDVTVSEDGEAECKRCHGHASEMDGVVTLNREYLNDAGDGWVGMLSGEGE